MYVLDTDICIYLLNGKAPAAQRRLSALPRHQLSTTAITAAELHFGALNSGRSEANLERVKLFLEPLRLLAFDGTVASHFGRLKLELKSKGTPIGLMDLLIASCAMASEAVLVTNNVREFRRIDGLVVENWSES